MRYSLSLVLVIAILIIPVSYALSASIGNARMILRPNIEDGETITIDKSILVNNINNISVKVTLEPEEHYKKIITVFDEEFILQPDESKDAQFRITLKSGGNYQGRVVVSFTPVDPSIKWNSVKLASSIIIIANGTVTDEYYRVMGENNTEEDIETEELDIVEEEVEEETATDSIEDEEDVSISIGSAGHTTSEKEEKTNLFIGVLVVIGIIAVGLCIFFAIKKLIK